MNDHSSSIRNQKLYILKVIFEKYLQSIDKNLVRLYIFFPEKFPFKDFKFRVFNCLNILGEFNVGTKIKF